MALTKFIKDMVPYTRYPERTLQTYLERYGDPFYLQIHPSSNKGVWVSGEAASSQWMFSAKPETFTRLAIGELFETLTGPGTLSLSATSEQHTQRKRTMRPFFSTEKIKLLGNTIQSCAFSEIKKWQAGERVNISATMKKIALEIITTTILGLTKPEEMAVFRESLHSFMESYTLFFTLSLFRNKFWSPWRKFSASREIIDRFLLEKIKLVQQTGQANRNDILSALTTLNLSENQLCNYLKEFLLAGYETGYISLGWTIFYAYSLPDIHKKLLIELQSLDNLSTEDIMKLPYLDAFCKEVLRHDPVVPVISRTLNAPCEFANKHLPAGSTVGISPILLHSNPAIWKNPTDFDPDRFLTQKFSNYEYVPFGGGTRMCLGTHFAMYEIKIVLVTFLLNCQLSNIPAKMAPNRMEGLALMPRKPIFATVDSLKKGDDLCRLM